MPTISTTSSAVHTTTNTHLPILAGEVLEYRQPSRVLRILLDVAALLALLTLTALLIIAG